MKLTVKKAFSWAHRGVQIEQFEPGQTIETEDQDLIDVSTKEGWASKGKVKSSEAAETTADANNASSAETRTGTDEATAE